MAASPPGKPSSKSLAAAEAGLIVAGFAVLFFLLPHAVGGDDLYRFDDIERLLHSGELSEGKYSLVMPLFSLPFLAFGEVVASPEWWAGRFNVIVVAAGTLATLLVLRGRVDGRVLRRCVLMLLFASLLTNRLRDYNAEVLTATLTVVGIALLSTGRSKLAGWGAIVVGVVNTPAAIVGLGFLVVVETVRTRRLRYVLPLAAAAALIMAEAWIRRGDPFVSGYEDDAGYATILPYSGRPGFSFPVVLGVLSILFSFGRGLLFFAPGLVLWLSSRTRRLAATCWPSVVLMLLFLGGLVLVYAKWWAWYGGIAWGPRFFVFAAVPASLALAFRLVRAGESALADAATLVVLALSAWVGMSGAIADPAALYFCAENTYALESLCWYVPEYSSLWHPVLQFPPLTTEMYLVVAYCALVFCYLAAPLVAGLLRAVAALRPRASWAAGWRV